MATIRITHFAGLTPEVTGRILPTTSAQIAHNCLLTDGTLRPQAQWQQQSIYESDIDHPIRSIVYNRSNDRAIMYASRDAMALDGAPFASKAVLGALLNPPVVRHIEGQGLTYASVNVYSIGVTGLVTYSPAYQSKKPTNRLYAVSRVRIIDGRIEEGSIACIIGDPTAQVFEGDLATLNISFTALDDNAEYVRIYRSISGLDTGEAVANELDTNWHLIAQVKVPFDYTVVYVDGGAMTDDMLDVFYAGQFHPPQLVARYFGLTETGWFVAASGSGEIAVSERFLHHAWPVENRYTLFEVITDMVCFMDTVFLGTNRKPYILSLQQGDKPLQGGAKPFPEPYKCLTNTMSASSSGAIYASPMGLVSLSVEGQKIITAAFTNAGDEFYSKVVDTVRYVASIGTTGYGAYYNGWYYGFCGGAPSETFF